MSAPESVRTTDGVVWTLRTVTSSGIALYAPQGVCECPSFVMATLAELAEHGIQPAELPAAVAAMGALPMKVGTEPQALSVERLTVLRKLRTHCEADRFESEDERPLHVWGPSQYPKREMCQRCTVTREWAEDADADEVVLVAEIDRLTAQRDRRRTHLVALQSDALNVRGALSPMGEDRKVPFPLGPTLLPAVEWLIGRVAELETAVAWRDAERERWSGVHYLIEKAIDKGWSGVDTCALEDELGPEPTVPQTVAEDGCSCPPADRPHQVGCPLDGVPVPEEPHDSPPSHDYRVGHDLPESGGAS